VRRKGARRRRGRGRTGRESRLGRTLASAVGRQRSGNGNGRRGGSSKRRAVVTAATTRARLTSPRTRQRSRRRRPRKIRLQPIRQGLRFAPQRPHTARKTPLPTWRRFEGSSADGGCVRCTDTQECVRWSCRHAVRTLRGSPACVRLAMTGGERVGDAQARRVGSAAGILQKHRQDHEGYAPPAWRSMWFHRACSYAARPDAKKCLYVGRIRQGGCWTS
jgi:hypothetical protein